MKNDSLEYSLQTRILHHKHKTDPTNGAVSVPIQHASTFHQEGLDSFGKYDYARSGNPTREALEDTIAQLENGTAGFAFASGMAAISTTFMMLSSGDHLVITEDVYGGTFRFTTEVLTKLGIEHTFVDMTKVEEVKQAIQPNTKMIYIETPSNPTMKITPIKAIVDLAKESGSLTVLDNTFMTPVLQRPLDLGVDVVVHSATKFIGGHSDVIAGLAVVKDSALAEKLGFLQNSFGAVLGPQDCWLILRGMKTMHTRMEASTKTAVEIAQWLTTHPAVKHVYYPGLKDHPGFDLHQAQSDSPGAVLSFELADREAVKKVVDAIEIPVFAVSLGAVESILSYPALMSHAAMPAHEREKRGISDGLLRLSVGLEKSEDLIKDFDQAFNQTL
ncbi:cystathionine gamma-synthase [Salipaludibacillus neizhouensis]|uniref:cysteine-S-conjugate beta-lyase n=1 Tax=Salipaludibacillus neizhouensis TaxID=885475 RepID=A0A3A9K0W6_9BACI|nr:cystathionine beta-lyase [Salipaludibacillus neizhouensis]RKL66367.1 cystathionine gamma-synthase [Salipaludibacillus neizhouensis]